MSRARNSTDPRPMSPKDQRAALIRERAARLFADLELTNQQIAERLGLSRVAVETLRFNHRKQAKS